jgi:hypothetical protein
MSLPDKLRSCGASMKVLGIADKQKAGRWPNSTAANSHQLFGRRERPMPQLMWMPALQKSFAEHASVDNQFNAERHLSDRVVRHLHSLTDCRYRQTETRLHSSDPCLRPCRVLRLAPGSGYGFAGCRLKSIVKALGGGASAWLFCAKPKAF